MKRDTYTSTELLKKAAQAAIQYMRDYTNFGEKRTTKLTWAVRGLYDYTYNNNDMHTYSADRLPDHITPPSLTRPEYMIADMINSPYTRQSNNSTRMIGSLNYSNTATAPGDSTLNPGFNVGFSLGYFHHNEHYDFEKPGIIDQHLKRTNDWLIPSIYFSFSSQNKIRSLTQTSATTSVMKHRSSAISWTTATHPIRST